MNSPLEPPEGRQACQHRDPSSVKALFNLQSCETIHLSWASQVAPGVKNLPAKEGDANDWGLTPGSGRSPGGGNGNPLWDSCLGNPMDRGSLVGYSPWGRRESDMTEATEHAHIWYRNNMETETDGKAVGNRQRNPTMQDTEGLGNKTTLVSPEQQGRGPRRP